jgi:hypothetical protein
MPSIKFTTQILNIAVTIHHGGLLGVSAAQTKDTFCCVSEGTWRSSTDIPRHTPGLHNVNGTVVLEFLILRCANHLHCAAMTAWVSLSMPSIRSINTRPSVFVTADGKIHKNNAAARMKSHPQTLRRLHSAFAAATRKRQKLRLMGGDAAPALVDPQSSSSLKKE